MANPSGRVSYINQTEYAYGKQVGQGRGVQEDTKFYDGQLTVLAIYQGRPDQFNVTGLFESVEGTARGFGEVHAIVETVLDTNVRQYKVEFYKITDAKYMAENVTENEPGNFKVSPGSRSFLIQQR